MRQQPQTALTKARAAAVEVAAKMAVMGLMFEDQKKNEDEL